MSTNFQPLSSNRFRVIERNKFIYSEFFYFGSGEAAASPEASRAYAAGFLEVWTAFVSVSRRYLESNEKKFGKKIQKLISDLSGYFRTQPRCVNLDMTLPKRMAAADLFDRKKTLL